MLLSPAYVRGDRFPTGWALYVGPASGVALGGYFGFWIFSLSFTSVAAGVVLVSAQSVFVAVLAYLVFGERTTPVSFAGILVALAGTAVIAADRTVGSAALSGNVLVLVGAVTVGIYVLTGRSSRTGGVGASHTPWCTPRRRRPSCRPRSSSTPRCRTTPARPGSGSRRSRPVPSSWATPSSTGRSATSRPP